MTTVPEMAPAVLCALVVAASAVSDAEEVVVAFVNPREADEFARRHGLEGRVVPLRFAVEMDRARMVDARVAQRLAASRRSA